MSRKVFATLGLVVILMVSLVGTVGAQSGTTATETPTSDAEGTTTTYVHPITQILAAYFGRNAVETATGTPTETPTTDPNATVDPNATPTGTPTVDPNATLTGTPTADATATETAKTPEELAQEIEAYHEAGMGFGVLVKLYSIAENYQTLCAAQTVTTGTTTGASTDTTTTTTTTESTGQIDPCSVTADSLVQEFKGGTGMGQLFKEYGKPALLGVGHVKHAQLEAESQGTTLEDGTQTTVEPTTTDKSNKQQQKNPKIKPQKTKKASKK